ncbi:MAG: IS21-like element helper ATPase IstB [Actinomycetota bacterium]|nr:IS21-like element helper ATPase IstB [Actinomycetota bacterium]
MTDDALQSAVHEMAVDAHLRSLKMPGALRAYRELARQAVAGGVGPIPFLEDVLAQEMESRRRNQVAQRLRDAHFPYPKDLESFDFSQAPAVPKARILDLARGEFTREHENVILIGASGLGKTHLGIGICRQVIYQGYRARFTTIAALMSELQQAQSRFDVPRSLRLWSRYDLIMIDEIGFVPLDPDGARLLFQFFAEMYERRSLLLTTNLEFSRWPEVFGDPVMTSALLDRLTHRAHLIPLAGESFRFRQAKERAAQTAAAVHS